MGDIAWSGLYVKAPADQLALALNRVAAARHFKLIKFSERVGKNDIEELRQYLTPAANYEVVGWYSVSSGWTRLVGFELSLGSYPRLLFPSEVILLLGCDAFECGFHERPNRWWYKYYENGLLIDRFEAKLETMIKPTSLPIWDPNDLGTIYAKCIVYRDYSAPALADDITLPPELAAYYRGNASGLLRLAKPESKLGIAQVLQETDPLHAIERLRDSLQLPDIGKFSLEELVELDFNWSDIDDYLRLLDSGLTITVFEHPRVALLADK